MSGLGLIVGALACFHVRGDDGPHDLRDAFICSGSRLKTGALAFDVISNSNGLDLTTRPYSHCLQLSSRSTGIACISWRRIGSDCRYQESMNMVASGSGHACGDVWNAPHRPL